MTGGDIAKLSFEDAMRELETIVRQLEAGRVGLEQSIQSYERGALLKHHCETLLGEAQAKIDAISGERPKSAQRRCRPGEPAQAG
jgi:exodeoxyribonuclease VII small subunit